MSKNGIQKRKGILVISCSAQPAIKVETKTKLGGRGAIRKMVSRYLWYSVVNKTLVKFCHVCEYIYTHIHMYTYFIYIYIYKYYKVSVIWRYVDRFL